MEDPQKRITVFRRALESTPEDSPQTGALYNNLALELGKLYKRKGRTDYLIEAIDAQRCAIGHTPESSPDLPGRLANLGNLLRTRYQAFGEANDLNEALLLCQCAVEMAGQRHPGRLGYMNNLGTCLWLRHLAGSSAAELDAAIDAMSEALGGTSEDSDVYPGYASNYAACLRMRYSLKETEEDLQAAIDTYRHAMRHCDESSANRALLMNNLGDALLHAHRRDQNRDHLEEAISLFEAAVTAVQDHPDLNRELPSFLNHLSHAQTTLFERTGHLDDLDKAITFGRRSVALTPEQAPIRATRLSNLGAALRYRYLRNRDETDLDRAIEALETAVQRSSPDAVDRARWQANLGNCLFERYQACGDAKDLNRAIDVYEAAVACSTAATMEHRRMLGNLGHGLRHRYQRDDNPDDLTRSIEIYQDLICQTPENSSELAVYFNNLAVSLGLRYLDGNKKEDLAAVLNAYRQSVNHSVETHPEICLSALDNWMLLVFSLLDWEETVEIYRFYKTVFDRLLHGQLLRNHKESWLRQGQGIGPRAAYSLAQLGQAREAVMALESSQSRLLSETMLSSLVYRDTPDDITESAPFREYRQAAERHRHWTLILAENEADDDHAISELRNAFTALNQALDLVRTVKPDFLRPPTFEDVAHAARQAPLVYITATELGGVALIVHPQDETPVTICWLPLLASEHVQKAVRYHISNTKAWQRAAEEQWKTELEKCHEGMGALTAWLGKALSPLWSLLDNTDEMVLIPIGLLNLLPLHLADLADGRCPMDLWNLRFALNTLTLGHADASATRNQSWDTVFIIHAADESNAPLGTVLEASVVKDHFAKVRTLSGSSAKQATFKKWPGSDVVHIACHGHSDLEKPLQSGLKLPGNEWLSLGDLLKQPWRPFRLAVLSACETHLPGTVLPEEVVSLSMGLLQMGAAGVIGSQWVVSDRVSMLLMAKFYDLWRHPDLFPAAALRSAQLWLRDSTPGEKTVFLKKLLPEDEVKAIRRAMGTADYSSPFYWGAFLLLGT